MEANENIQAECRSIGLQNEKSLHSSIKHWYSKKGDRLEVRVDGFVIDIVRDDELIEIQTKNFFAISKKLKKLCKNHKVKLVHPISRTKWIKKIDMEGNVISVRKSPKKGTVFDVFDELVSIPELINEENFSLEILIIDSEELRCDNGKGSWRRKGISIVDKKLLNVIESYQFKSREDFISFIPDDITKPFTNKSLSAANTTSLPQCRKLTYCLKKMGIIREEGKKGKELLFNIQE